MQKTCGCAAQSDSFFGERRSLPITSTLPFKVKVFCEFLVLVRAFPVWGGEYECVFNAGGAVYAFLKAEEHALGRFCGCGLNGREVQGSEVLDDAGVCEALGGVGGEHNAEAAAGSEHVVSKLYEAVKGE